ncbi:MAG: DNA-binding protein Alba [Promethearchaeota archaeon]
MDKKRQNRRESDNNVYIGKRPTMNYVMAVMVILNKEEDNVCTIKARGRSISHAVDVAEITKNKFIKTAKYKDIRLSTEQLENEDGRSSNVSSIEIELVVE